MNMTQKLATQIRSAVADALADGMPQTRKEIEALRSIALLYARDLRVREHAENELDVLRKSELALSDRAGCKHDKEQPISSGAFLAHICLECGRARSGQIISRKRRNGK